MGRKQVEKILSNENKRQKDRNKTTEDKFKSFK